MIFEGRDIPEVEFQTMARRAFFAVLEEQDNQVVQAKAEAWFSRTEATEQEMFERWLRELGVKPFSLKGK